MSNRHHADPRPTRLPPRDATSEPITEPPVPPDDERCPLLLPGTDIRCAAHTHPPTAACAATGVRDGVRFSAFFWRAT